MTVADHQVNQHVQHLALRETPGLPSASEWATLLEMARVLVPTNFLPATIKTPEQAVAIILKGRELRVPPMQALGQIVVVQGKPTCSAELMLALIYRDHGDLAVVVEESTAEVCRVAYRRRGWDRARLFAFTIGDARTAELAGKGTWKQYPQAMLRARCISAVARLAFPDSIGGMHTPEELGAVVYVDHEGRVEVASVMDTVHEEPEPVPALSGRGEEIAAGWDATMAAADALVAEPVREPVPPEGLGDDVESLTGDALVEACQRMRRALAAANVAFAEIPYGQDKTVNKLRLWWRQAAAMLAARQQAR